MGTDALMCDTCLVPLGPDTGRPYFTSLIDTNDLCEDCWLDLSYDDREWYEEVND